MPVAVRIDKISLAVRIDKTHMDKVIVAAFFLQIRQHRIQVHGAVLTCYGSNRVQGLDIPVNLGPNDILILGYNLLHILLRFFFLGAFYTEIADAAYQHQNDTDN